MKKLMALLLSLVTVLSMTCVAFAGEMPTTSNTYPAEYEYFDDGSYIVTTITEEPAVSFARAGNTKTGSKTSKYYSSSGTAMWYVTVNGTFSYNGSTATCTNASVTAGSYSASWKINSKSSKHSGSSASGTAKATMYDTYGNYVKSATKTVTLTCSKTGTLS